MYNCAPQIQLITERIMDAEQLNAIANKIADLRARSNELRGYL